MFLSSYRNTVLNQSACVFALGYFLKRNTKCSPFRVSVKRGLRGRGLFLNIFSFFSFCLNFFLFFNPNSDFSQFASAVHRYNIVGHKENEIRWSSFVRHITANNPSHISVKTVKCRSCTNLFSSSALISAIEVSKEQVERAARLQAIPKFKVKKF